MQFYQSGASCSRRWFNKCELVRQVGADRWIGDRRWQFDGWQLLSTHSVADETACGWAARSGPGRELVDLPGDLTVRGLLFPNDGRVEFVRWRSVLSLVGCEKVTELPEMQNINGSVDLADCGVEDLSDEQLIGLEVRWRGVPIQARFLFRPKKIAPEEIFQQHNVEVRRVMLERVGTNRLMQMTNSRVIDSDHDAGGLRRLIHFRIQTQAQWVDEELRFLNCFCPSTGREYLLQVPQTVTTCHAAAAWLAGFDDSNDYRPIVET